MTSGRGRAPAHAASRALALSDVFTTTRLEAVWRHVVRQGLRKQPVADLHDYLDVHRNIKEHAARIRELVLWGKYRPTPPEVTTSEKVNGVARRLLLPSPTDAMVLQVLADVLQPVIDARKPTKNAFYSVNRNAPRGPEAIDGTFGYEWWILWPEFQRRIWEFARSCPFVVVADLATYFDTVPHAPLRNTIAAMGQLEEPVLDLLFYTLEAFTWRPYYLPPSGVGLPQIDIEAPRLLGHAYLFAADEYLASATHNHVVRWMDDVDFGVASVADARRILGELEALLNSRGLRLNSAKTTVLSAKEAVVHFCMKENQRLTMVEQRLDAGMLTGEALDRARIFLRKEWRAFKRRRPSGQHEKIRKRFLTIFGKLGDDVLQVYVRRMLCDAPKLREPALRYFRSLGFSPRRFATMEHYMVDSGSCLDDASLFAAARLLVAWRVPPGRHLRRVVALAQQLPLLQRHSVTAFLAGLWVLVKYATERDLNRYIAEHQDLWTHSAWAARQVAAALPRMEPRLQQSWSDRMVHAGLYDGVGVVAHYHQLRRLTQLDQQLRTYLLHPVGDPFNFELPKLLIALVILDGAMSDGDKAALQDELLRVVTDPVMRELLLSALPGRVQPPAIGAGAPATTELGVQRTNDPAPHPEERELRLA